MTLIVTLITDDLFPKAPLPNGPFSLLQTPWCKSFPSGNWCGKSCFDIMPAPGETRIPGRQSSEIGMRFAFALPLGRIPAGPGSPGDPGLPAGGLPALRHLPGRIGVEVGRPRRPFSEHNKLSLASYQRTLRNIAPLPTLDIGPLSMPVLRHLDEPSLPPGGVQ